MKGLCDNYFGFLVDSHITDHDPSFLSKLTPEGFVAKMKQTGADSVMVYAWCHNGNCYYPTKLGYQHPALHGRDHFGETVRLLRAAGILPRAYTTVVYHRRVARTHPEWRVSQFDGAQNYRRSWYCCPNSVGYRDYAKAMLREVAAYDIESLFIDMTFWPGICACHSCRELFMKETGREIPQTVDWNDTAWVTFHRTRERWLSDFAHDLTGAVKGVNSKIAVAHQFGPVLLGWMYGQTSELARAQDVPSGDFYGGRWQQRFGCKMLSSFEKELPFEYMTSRCVTLYDHTSTKSDDEMERAYATTLANGGTFLLIDAINPDGTLEPGFYDRVPKIAQRLRPYKDKLAQLRPKLVADIGLYYSTTSYVRRDHNGQSVRNIMNPVNNMLAITDLRPLQEVIATSIVLNRAKILYRVLNDATKDFPGLKAIILNDAAILSAGECDRLREFVRNGGTLIATGQSSYYSTDGKTTGDFALKDIFGVSFTGKFSRDWNYLVPEQGELISCDAPAPLVRTTTAKVLARLAEPMFDKDDFEHFASYHSNPPAPAGEFAAMTVNRFGQGTCVYLAQSILVKQLESQQAFAERVFREYASSSILLSCNAPPCVEVTLLRSTKKSSYLLCLVNYQDEPANVPVSNIAVSIRLPGSAIATTCTSVATNQPVAVERADRRLSFRISKLETIEMIEIETKESNA